MKIHFKKIPSLLKLSFERWKSDHAIRLAASLAYYTAFSLAPLLLAAIAVGGLVFGDEAASGRIYDELKNTLGPSVATSIQDLVEAARKPAHGVVGAVLAFVLVLFGASGVFGELKDSLNIIWKQQPKAGSGLWAWIRGRFLSIGMVLGVCFLLLVSLGPNTALGAAYDSTNSIVGMPPALMQGLGMLISFGFITLLFALMFKYLPDTKVAWNDVWTGSVFTAILFTLGKSGLEIYLSKAAVASSFGAAGALALVLVWVYYSAQIFLMGAEFTAVYAEQLGSKVKDARKEPAAEGSKVKDARLETAAEAPRFVPPIPIQRAAPVTSSSQDFDPAVPALERLAKVLALKKPGKLKPSQQWGRLLGAGLVLSAARMMERWKERRGGGRVS